MDMRSGGRRASDRAVFLGRSHDVPHHSEKAQSEDRAFTGLILDLRMERHEPSPRRGSSTASHGPSGAYDAQNIVQGAANPGSAGCFVGPRKSRPRLDSFCNAVDRAHASPPPAEHLAPPVEPAATRPRASRSTLIRRRVHRCRLRTLYPYRRRCGPRQCPALATLAARSSRRTPPSPPRRPRESPPSSMRQQTRSASAPARGRRHHEQQ